MDKYHVTNPPTLLKSAVLGSRKEKKSILIKDRTIDDLKSEKKRLSSVIRNIENKINLITLKIDMIEKTLTNYNYNEHQ